MDTEAVLSEFRKRYGSAEAMRVYLTVIPPVIADFKGMLEQSVPGTELTEEYRLEDGKGTIRLTGSRRTDGTKHVDIQIL